MYDIKGDILAVGDTVYYARKHNYEARGELVIETITKITGGTVYMGRYNTRTPSSQIAKI